MKGRKRHKIILSKIKKGCRTLFTKQLSLVYLAVMSIIMNCLLKSNGKDNSLKSRFCLYCKNFEMLLRSFWHNTVYLSHFYSKYIKYIYSSSVRTMQSFWWQICLRNQWFSLHFKPSYSLLFTIYCHLFLSSLFNCRLLSSFILFPFMLSSACL